MKKRLLAAFACLCMLLTLLPAAVFAGEVDGTITPGSEVPYTFEPSNRDTYGMDAQFQLELPEGVTMETVTVGDVRLTEGKDYAMIDDETVLVLKNDYLSTLDMGKTTELSVNLSDGGFATILITVPLYHTVTIESTPANAAWAAKREGDYTSIRDAFYVKPGESIILEPEPIDCYTFTGWLVNGAAAGDAEQLTLTPEGDTVVTVCCEVKQLSVTPDSDKLEFGSLAVGYAQPEGQLLTITNTSDMKVNCAFQDLRPNPDDPEIAETDYYEILLVELPSSEVMRPGDSIVVRVRPKADLPAGTYTETLNVLCEYNSEPDPVMARSGDEGDMWEKPAFPDPITVPVTLSFTVYEPCTVTFDANGHGTAPAALENVQPGTAIAAPTAPEAEGWTFLGWYREASCENAWNFDTDLVEGSMTLYAKWEQKTAPTPVPTETPAPSATPAPSEQPSATEQPAATEKPSATQQPAATAQPTATAQPAAAQAPQTGDSSMLAWLGLAGAAVCGLVALERLRKKG